MSQRPGRRGGPGVGHQTVPDSPGSTPPPGDGPHRGDLPNILDVPQVLARYGLRDPKAARRLMNQAGAFLAGGRLVVRADDLAAWELQQRAERCRVGTGNTPQRAPRRRVVQPHAHQQLEAGWWREGRDS